jgi:phenylpropionate dioxygenase-like ring-hydroxylating dioxygenase large terminal subunit
MISAEKNEQLTQVGENTPGGQLLRHYWQPVLLAEELDGPRPLKAVELMGGQYIVFRDQSGNLGMLDRQCPHRGADLAFGRLENAGVRCAFHGWLFDAEGKCLETPAEPAGSNLCARVRQPSYPVVEKSGIIFAYLGKGTPPAFPHFDCFEAPDSHTFAFKGLWECNWLQALEVGIDPAHASFLHRFFEDEETQESYGKQFRGHSADSQMAITQVLREYDCPEISVATTPYGMQLTTLRKLSEAQTHVRVTNLMFPQAFVIPMSSEMTITQWHVPVDDTHSYWFAIFTSFGEAVDKDQMRAQRLQTIELPLYTSRKNKRNDYGYSVEEQATQTYTGMGSDINVHDQWACESMGPIQDRTREHLGTTDKAILTYRRMLLSAMDSVAAGGTAPMLIDEQQARALTGPAAIDGVASNDEVGSYCEKTDRARRASAPWGKNNATA